MTRALPLALRRHAATLKPGGLLHGLSVFFSQNRMIFRLRIRRLVERFVPSPGILALAFLVAGTVLWLNDRFFFESVCVVSSSMCPTLLKNERLYLQKAGIGAIRRFDAVVIDSRALHHRIIKRVIGLPGDLVRLEDSYRVFINGQSLDYAPQPGHPDCQTEASVHAIQLRRNPKFFYETIFGKNEIRLGPDEFYVLGDNRLASGDSRAFGPVKRAEIQGRVTRIWYSFDLDTGRFRWERVGVSIR